MEHRKKKVRKVPDTLTDSGGKGSTGDPHLTGNDQYIIKNHVENAGTDHKPKTKSRFSRSYKVGTETVLAAWQPVQRAWRHQDRPDSLPEEFPLEPRKREISVRFGRDSSIRRKTEAKTQDSELGQSFSGIFPLRSPKYLLMIALPPVPSMVEMAIATLITGNTMLRGGQSIASHKAGDEHTVHDSIQRHKYHHNDGRCREF